MLYNDIFSYGQHFGLDTQIVKDTIQSLFLNFLNKRKDLNELKNVRSYIFRSFRNLLIKNISDEKSFLLLEDNDIEEVPETDFDEEKVAKVKRLLLALTAREKEVVLLKYYHDYSNTEISEVLGIEYSTVCNISTQATKKIIKENNSLSDIVVLILLDMCNKMNFEI